MRFGANDKASSEALSDGIFNTNGSQASEDFKVKRVFGGLLFSCSLFLINGCGGSGGGAVTDGVEMSNVEKYEANLAAAEADLGGSPPEDAGQ
ncbi:MAG: hypothetical protein ACR2NZ_09730 [Rubripirellula sp.]